MIWILWDVEILGTVKSFELAAILDGVMLIWATLFSSSISKLIDLTKRMSSDLQKIATESELIMSAKLC